MDLPLIKKEEPVEYFLISTSEGDITAAFDQYSNDINLSDVIGRQIKEEPTEPPEYGINKDLDNAPRDSRDVKEPEKISDEEWTESSNAETKKSSKTMLVSKKYKFKYQVVSTEDATSDGPPYTCKICSLTFPTKKSFRVHQSYHEGKKYQCSICSKVFREKGNIHEHMKIHEEPQYSCPICSKMFAIRKSWIHHRSVHEEKKFQCDICSKFFRQKAHLWDHMKVHRERTKKFKCELCDMGYFEQRTLTRHIKVAHSITPRKRFRCPNTLCDKDMSSIAAFKTHACVDGKRPQNMLKTDCSICKKRFFTKCELIRHVKRLHSAKPANFTCSRCKKTFQHRYWDSFVMHFAQNCPAVITYKCDLCSQLLRSKPKIIEHFAGKHNIISDLMKIPCPICQKMFFYKHKLNCHIEAHHRELRCKHCNHKFMSKTRYDKHILQKQCIPKNTFEKYSKDIINSDQKSEINIIEHVTVVKPEKTLKLNNKSCANFVCSICHESFQTGPILRQHKNRIHEDQRTFQCEKCNVKFTGAGIYLKHSKICKTGNSQCSVCLKVFAKNFSLKRHFQSMHLFKSEVYQCDHCLKKFARKNSLLRHIKKGDHQTSFKCDMCLKLFKRKSSWKTHMIYCRLKSPANESALKLS